MRVAAAWQKCWSKYALSVLLLSMRLALSKSRGRRGVHVKDHWREIVHCMQGSEVVFFFRSEVTPGNRISLLLKNRHMQIQEAKSYNHEKSASCSRGKLWSKWLYLSNIDLLIDSSPLIAVTSVKFHCLCCYIFLKVNWNHNVYFVSEIPYSSVYFQCQSLNLSDSMAIAAQLFASLKATVINLQ